MIGQTSDKIDLKKIEEFSKSCYDFALKNHTGWPRGIQAAVGSIAILQGNDIDDEAVRFCEKMTKKHWSAFEISVLYRADEKKTIRYKHQPIWGAAYFPFFTKTIDGITGQF
jgi:hypothetical protein